MRILLLIVTVAIFTSAKSQESNLFDLKKHLQKNLAEQNKQLGDDASKDNLNSYRAMRFPGIINRNLKPNNSIALGIISNPGYQWPTLGLIPNLKVNPVNSAIIPNAAIPNKYLPVK